MPESPAFIDTITFPDTRSGKSEHVVCHWSEENKIEFTRYSGPMSEKKELDQYAIHSHDGEMLQLIWNSLQFIEGTLHPFPEMSET